MDQCTCTTTNKHKIYIYIYIHIGKNETFPYLCGCASVQQLSIRGQQQTVPVAPGLAICPGSSHLEIKIYERMSASLFRGAICRCGKKCKLVYLLKNFYKFFRSKFKKNFSAIRWRIDRASN
jgi:hypothetical protein